MGLLTYQIMEEITFPSVQELKTFNLSRYKYRQDFFHYFKILEQQMVDPLMEKALCYLLDSIFMYI
jgi:hypothetical protein